MEKQMLRLITDEEMTVLQFATVRESCERRGWPTEVVEAFLAAEVIRGRKQRRTETPPCAKVGRQFSADRPARFGVLMYD